MKLEPVLAIGSALRTELLDVWERSVRATHHFLTDETLVALRPEVSKGFDCVSLVVAFDKGRALGFSGTCGDSLEMLFVDTITRGKGVGRCLLEYAVQSGVWKLDVNEQNPQAKGFYEHMGFIVAQRSALDRQGRPFPLLHMVLPASARAFSL